MKADLSLLGRSRTDGFAAVKMSSSRPHISGFDTSQHNLMGEPTREIGLSNSIDSEALEINKRTKYINASDQRGFLGTRNELITSSYPRLATSPAFPDRLGQGSTDGPARVVREFEFDFLEDQNGRLDRDLINARHLNQLLVDELVKFDPRNKVLQENAEWGWDLAMPSDVDVERSSGRLQSAHSKPGRSIYGAGDPQKGQDSLKTELDKTTNLKDKLEKLCRELTQENKKLKDEKTRLEDSRYAVLPDGDKIRSLMIRSSLLELLLREKG
jgi:hypothetical protein